MNEASFSRIANEIGALIFLISTLVVLCMQVINWLAMRRIRKAVAQLKHATNSLMDESREAARVVGFAADLQQGSDDAERAAGSIRAPASLAVRAAPQLTSTERTS